MEVGFSTIKLIFFTSAFHDFNFPPHFCVALLCPNVRGADPERSLVGYTIIYKWDKYYYFMKNAWLGVLVTIAHPDQAERNMLDRSSNAKMNRSVCILSL